MLFFNVLISAIVFFALTFPLLTGYIAASNGRSFWRWYGLGLVLPFFSVFVVMVIAMRDQLAEEKRADAAKLP
jgi:hypothetical protein